MQLTFIDVDAKVNIPKATIHITGKLGFNKEAEKLMQLTEQGYYRLAVEGSMDSFTNICLVESSKGEKGSLKVARSADYYSLQTKTIFEKLQMNYKRYKIIFDIEKKEHEGQIIFILKKRKKDIVRKAD